MWRHDIYFSVFNKELFDEDSHGKKLQIKFPRIWFSSSNYPDAVVLM